VSEKSLPNANYGSLYQMCSRPDRRQFLKHLAAGAAVSAATAVGAKAATKKTTNPEGPKLIEAHPENMPTVKFGKHTISRLIAGSNPLEGISHSTQNLANHMREYYTVDRIADYLLRCEKHGINTWQMEYKDILNEALQMVRDRGSKIQIMHLSADHWMAAPIKKLAEQKTLAVIHHGGITDHLFRAKKYEKVCDYLKQIKDAGMMAGVSCHNPNCIKYIEDKGWEEVDFYMGCSYHLTRPMQEIRDKLGTGILDEPFLESDRDEMVATIKQVSKPCILFKILAAGRHCGTAKKVERAFKYAFENIKKTDVVLVGMYTRFKDEIGENAQLTHKYGQLA